MSTQKCDFNPFTLLAPANVRSFGLKLFKGAGSNNTHNLWEYGTEDDTEDRTLFTYNTTSETLYFRHKKLGVPVKFKS